MLKRRIIPLLLLQDDKLVKTKKFNKFRDVGNPITTAKIYSTSEADELIFLNIDKNKDISKLIKYLEAMVENCFVPISVGGGIKKLSDAIQIIKSGADKIIINTICYENKSIVKQITEKLGSQAVIASLDVRYDNQKYILFSNNGTVKETIDLNNHIKDLNNTGVGEILINSIDLEGTMSGPDLKLNEMVSKISRVPVIYSGGIGNYDHIKILFEKSNISAVACGSMFNFTNTDPIMVKSYLLSNKLNLRIF